MAVRRPFCTAFARSRGRQCCRPVGYRKDGSLHVVCPSHGSLSTGPRTEAGKAIVAAAQRLKWQRYRAGLCDWRAGRRPAPAVKCVPPDPHAEAAERRARAIAELKRLGYWED
jgi:hypothetical protein